MKNRSLTLFIYAELASYNIEYLHGYHCFAEHWSNRRVGLSVSYLKLKGRAFYSRHASNLEQIVNLLNVLRPTQPPTLSGTGNEWQLTFELVGAVLCMLAAPLVQCPLALGGSAWPDNVPLVH